MLPTGLDQRAISKMIARAKGLRTTHPDLSHNARLDIVARELGYQSWKSARRLAARAAFQPRVDDPRARRLLERAWHLGADTIRMDVGDGTAHVSLGVHTRNIAHEDVPEAAAKALLAEFPDAMSMPIVGGAAHLVRLYRPLAWADMQPGPAAQQVVDWWAESPHPGVLLVSSPFGRERVSAALLAYATAKARPGKNSLREFTREREDGSLAAVSVRDKTIVPLASDGPEGAVWRVVNMLNLPEALLAGEAVFSACVYVHALPLLCQHCAEVAQPPATGNPFRGPKRVGEGCEHCWGLGTVGIKYFVEAHGITTQTIAAARAHRWSEPGWAETLEGNFSQGTNITVSTLAAAAVAAGQVDPVDAWHRLGQA